MRFALVLLMSQTHTQFLNVFTIFGKGDAILFEIDLTPSTNIKRYDTPQSLFYATCSSLDVVDELLWTQNAMNLKIVDKNSDKAGDIYASAFVTASHHRFVLLHVHKDEDSINSFFNDVYQAFVKMIMNPFYDINTPITSSGFDNEVRAAARRYLNVTG